MRKPLLCVLTLLLLGTARAQVVSDTLDPRRYFPLEVGNTWQYVETPSLGAPLPTYHRYTITRDTVARGHRYFRQHAEFFDAGFSLAFQREAWLRYDEAGVVRSFPDLRADTASIALPVPWYHHAFGDTLATYDTTIWVVDGRYDTTIWVGGRSYAVAAVKALRWYDAYWDAFFQLEEYAAGVGWLSSSVHDGPTTDLVYGQVGGKVYGTPAVTVARETQDARPVSLVVGAVYPQPARDHVTLDIASVGRAPGQVVVYDLLGRRVMDRPLDRAEEQIVLDVSGLSGGLYLVVVAAHDGGMARLSLVIAR